MEMLKEQPKSTHDILEEEKEKLGRAAHLLPYQFKKGQSGNPNGRPPGKSLKERAKAMLNSMTDEEEQEFLNGIDKKTIWEMAEGKPEAKTDITSGGKPIIQLATEVAEKYDIPPEPVDNSQK